MGTVPITLPKEGPLSELKIVTQNKDGMRSYAKPGDTVEVDELSVKLDSDLASLRTDKTTEKKADPYESATVETLREALKAKDLPHSGSKAELVATAKKHAVKL